ncbi:MAG: hypothetical protein AB7O24_21320 [Kofleriaceae bacterium]
MQSWLSWLLAAGVAVLAGCPNIAIDPGEGVDDPIARAVVELDPSNRILPVPNNLLLDPATGKVNLPPGCNETPAATATRMALNQLDGFGAYQVPIQVTFSQPFDTTSLTGRVVMYKRTSAAMPFDPLTEPGVPVDVVKTETTRFDRSCENPAQVSTLTIVPQVPLEQRSTYTVAILAGVRVLDSKLDETTDFGPSALWSLIRERENPVTLNEEGHVLADRTPLDPSIPDQLDQLRGIDRLWRTYVPTLAFLEQKQHARADVLLAWEFTTQTVTDPLDPTVVGSPASKVAAQPLIGMQSMTCDYDATTCPLGIERSTAPYVLCDPAGGGPGTDTNTQCMLKIALGVASGAEGMAIYPAGNAACAAVGCAAVGDIVGGLLSSTSYQADVANSFDADQPIPGAWSDPVHPTEVKQQLISVLAIIPATTAPTTGYPTVVFGHPLGETKSSLFAIGPQLAASPAHYASVAIDFVAHGSRAVRISDADAEGCADTGTPAAPPSSSDAPHCYAPLLSPDLAATRDNLRQSVLDVQGLVAGLKACGTAMCSDAADFTIDPNRISYVGMSLTGGVLGSVIAATTPDLKASVLNTPGVGWLDILEDTQRLELRCPLVDALIDAGTLAGDKSVATGDPPMITSGLCTTADWSTQPGYRQFSAVARWLLDAAEPANFAPMLADRTFLMQEIVDDAVVPNATTDVQAVLVDQTKRAADCASSSAPAPSSSLVSSPTASVFMTYPSLMIGGACSPGNEFEHGSLLQPAAGRCSSTVAMRCTADHECPNAEACIPSGRLGTARLQTDAIGFVTLHQD